MELESDQLACQAVGENYWVCLAQLSDAIDDHTARAAPGNAERSPSGTDN